MYILEYIFALSNTQYNKAYFVTSPLQIKGKHIRAASTSNLDSDSFPINHINIQQKNWHYYIS